MLKVKAEYSLFFYIAYTYTSRRVLSYIATRRRENGVLKVVSFYRKKEDEPNPKIRRQRHDVCTYGVPVLW